MNKKFNIGILIFVNLVILVTILAAIECGYRVFGSDRVEYGVGIFSQVFQPYLMFSNSPTSSPDQPTEWNDQYRKTKIPAINGRNNLGFRMDSDVDYTKVYNKDEDERFIIVTGGSAMHSVGATKNEKNIAAILEKTLNEEQNTYKYKVFNLSIGAGVAFQEYLALALWGKWMNPDWVIVMDGHNDIAVCSAHSQGAAVPLYYPQMKSYIDGYMTSQASPPFYRGWLENQIIKYSAAYRAITKKQYVPKNQYITRAEGWERVGVDVKWDDIEKQVVFYLHAQELILGLSPHTKYTLSLQPVTVSFSQIFDENNDDLNALAKANRNKSFGGPVPFYQLTLSYFFSRAEQGLEALTAKYSKSTDVQYINIGSYLPEDFEDRKNFLIDNMHLNDEGQDLVGKAYAYNVMSRDFPSRKNEFSKKLTTLLDSVHAVATKKIDNSPGIHIIEASYGLNCRGIETPAGYNTVKTSNATQYAKRLADGKTRSEIPIDAAIIGDPANSCLKDFQIHWSCGDKAERFHKSVPGEANGKAVVLTCPE